MPRHDPLFFQPFLQHGSLHHEPRLDITVPEGAHCHHTLLVRALFRASLFDAFFRFLFDLSCDTFSSTSTLWGGIRSLHDFADVRPHTDRLGRRCHPVVFVLYTPPATPLSG